MDELDKKILAVLAEDARVTVKTIAQRVSLTSPAVSERIRRMEKNGTIAGYTVRYNPDSTRQYIHAIISIQVAPADRDAFFALLQQQQAVEQCFQVTGAHSHMVKVCCKDISALEKLISKMQKLGPTNTQIVLSVMEKNGPFF